MMKILVRFDEAKIASEQKYKLDTLIEKVDSIFGKRNMYRDESDWYTNGDFVKCGSAILKLKDTDWFINNIKEWLWYDSFDSSVEDIKAHYDNRGHNLFG